MCNTLGGKKKVADRLIEIWQNIKKLIQFWAKLPKSKQPTCKSYKNVKDAVEDPFVITKLTFFSFISRIVEPYLKMFQSDKPMVPFLYFELKSVIKSLMELIVKSEVLEECKTSSSLKSLDLSKGDNLLHPKNVELGFGVKDLLLN